MKDVCFYFIIWWVAITLINQDDNFARYIGQLGCEVAKGFASGGVP